MKAFRVWLVEAGDVEKLYQQNYDKPLPETATNIMFPIDDNQVLGPYEAFFLEENPTGRYPIEQQEIRAMLKTYFPSEVMVMVFTPW